MLIVDKDKNCDTNDDIKTKLPVKKWKDYAKGASSTIDVIIFKMVISEGWDIPRACMLCQVRKTVSDRLDEQVIGRVRRNPRLLDFEALPIEAQRLASTAWVWGTRPKDKDKKSFNVHLFPNSQTNVRQNFIIKTTKLGNLKKKKGFDIKTFLNQKQEKATATDIFTLHGKLQKQENEIQNLCYDYCGEDFSLWWKFNENIDSIKKEYNNYICDYSQSMQEDKETSFPVSSIYWGKENSINIENWIWVQRTEDEDIFNFDSLAEKRWAKILRDISEEKNNVAPIKTR